MSVESGSDSSAEGENVREQPPRKYVPPIRPVGRGAYGIVCNLCNNKIGGNIPLSLPPNLEELLLSGNEINGLIPPSISSLSQIVAMKKKKKERVGRASRGDVIIYDLWKIGYMRDSKSTTKSKSMGKDFYFPTSSANNQRREREGCRKKKNKKEEEGERRETEKNWGKPKIKVVKS